jgi:hypothetical protein
MSDVSRRSLPRRAAKRKAEEEEAATNEQQYNADSVKKSRLEDTTSNSDAVAAVQQSPEQVAQLLSYQWIDEGKSRPNGQADHQLLEIVIKGKTTIVAVGDAILLSSGNDDSSDQDAFVAKVDSMWQQPARKNKIREHCMKIRAQWYFKVSSVLAYCVLREHSLPTYIAKLHMYECVVLYTPRDSISHTLVENRR